MPATLALATTAVFASGPASGSSAAPSQAVEGVLDGRTVSGRPIPCTARSDRVRVCHADIDGPGGADLRIESFDGTPLAAYVTLPPAPDSGTDGGYPLIVQSHGWGAPPSGPDDPQYAGPTAAEWAADGYAVVQLTARGWGTSCGTEASRAVAPEACAGAYIRLDDVRYEARDVQHSIGLLVDDGIADPDRIGLTGESYGSGVSLEVATLDDRVVEDDGSVRPWTSPDGTALSIAAAVPLFGWTDLPYALMPNGRTLDAGTVAPEDLSPPGVWKDTIGSGLFLVGQLSGYYAADGTDPEADVPGWFETMGEGEPYGADTEAVFAQGVRYNSPYYLLAGIGDVEPQEPPPLLIVSGFTDAVFPVDESLRYYHLHRELHPDAPISLHHFDGGHQRAQNKPADVELLRDRIHAFLDHHVGGNGATPDAGVTVLSQTCPIEEPSGGPFEAATWADLHPGEVRLDAAATQVVRSDAGDDEIGNSLDPIAGGLACTTVPAADQGDGVATYRLPTPTGEGYTLLGAPTITADLEVTGPHAYVAGRLFDVDPETDTAVLVARGVYRIDPDAPDGRVTFQLHANAWHFAPGHIAKLELLGRDAPFLRPSNGDFSVEVSNLHLQLPVHEVPGAAGTPAEVQPFTPLAGTGDTETPEGDRGSEESSDSGATPWIVGLLVLAAVAVAVGVFVVVRTRRTRPDGSSGGSDG